MRKFKSRRNPKKFKVARRGRKLRKKYSYLPLLVKSDPYIIQASGYETQNLHIELYNQLYNISLFEKFRNLYQQYKVNWIRLTVSPIVDSGTFPPLGYGLFLTNDNLSVQYSRIPTMPGSVKIQNRKSTSIFIKNRGRQNDFNYWNDTNDLASPLTCSYRIRLAQPLGELGNNRVGYTIQIKYALSFRRLFPKEENKENIEEKYENIGASSKEINRDQHKNAENNNKKKLNMEDILDSSQLSKSLLEKSVGEYSEAYSRGYEKCYKDTQKEVDEVGKVLQERTMKYHEMFEAISKQNEELRNIVSALQEQIIELKKSNKPLEEKLGKSPMGEIKRVKEEPIEENVEEIKTSSKGKPQGDFEKMIELFEKEQAALDEGKQENIVVEKEQEIKPINNPPKEPPKDPPKDPKEEFTRTTLWGMFMGALVEIEKLSKEKLQQMYKEYTRKLKKTKFDHLPIDERIAYKIVKYWHKNDESFKKIPVERIIGDLVESLHRSNESITDFL